MLEQQITRLTTPRSGLTALAMALSLTACPFHVDGDAMTLTGQGDDPTEHCIVSDYLADLLDLHPGAANDDGGQFAQLRIVHDDVEALCTVTGTFQSMNVNEQFEIRMNEQEAADSLNIMALPSTTVGASNVAPSLGCGEYPSPGLEECLQRALFADRFVIAAPHGGKIEAHTDEQAEHVYAEMNGLANGITTSWIVRGERGEPGSFSSYHITSTEIGWRSFPKLREIAPAAPQQMGFTGFDYAVSFHGFGAGNNENPKQIIIGGRVSSNVKQTLVANLQQRFTGIGLTTGVGLNVDVEIVIANGGSKGGQQQANLVNWLTTSGNDGLQIEQTSDVREDHWELVADAVVDTLITL